MLLYLTYQFYLGIFTQPDTVIPNVYDPQKLNRYMFERGNPYNYVDIDGHNPAGYALYYGYIILSPLFYKGIEFIVTKSMEKVGEIILNFWYEAGVMMYTDLSRIMTQSAVLPEKEFSKVKKQSTGGNANQEALDIISESEDDIEGINNMDTSILNPYTKDIAFGNGIDISCGNGECIVNPSGGISVSCIDGKCKTEINNGLNIRCSDGVCHNYPTSGVTIECWDGSCYQMIDGGWVPIEQ